MSEVAAQAAAPVPKEQHTPHGDGKYIPALDGWRAIAIVLVVMFHAMYNVIAAPSDQMTGVLALLSHLGALGVLIFFAISGYIITTRLHAEAPNGNISLRRFYGKRCFRILPAMWVYLLVLAMLGGLHVIVLERRDLMAPLFLANYFPGSPYTTHFWSLAIEEHFYLLWPLCLLLAGWRRAIAVGVALMAAVGVYRALVLHHLFATARSAPFLEGLRGEFLSHTEARIDYILAGCVLALLLLNVPAARRVVGALGSGSGAVVMLAVILLSASTRVADLRSLQAIVIALLVVATSLRAGTLMNRVLASAPLVWVGKLSYSLYLWQQLFLARSSVGWLQTPFALVPRVSGALLAAYVSCRFLERPMIRLGSEYLGQRKLTTKP